MTAKVSSYREIVEFFKSRNKRVITFAGYGELGYQQTGRVEQVARPLLAAQSPDSVMVNTGTLLRVQGEAGIAAVYKLALQMGIETSGIHPGIALSCVETHPLSPFEQHSFYVRDSSWGGFIEPYPTLSPTLQVMLAVSDELVVIGGGKHAADELKAFHQRGKKVSYYAAEMNHQSVLTWSRVAGVTVEDFRGEAFHTWQALEQVPGVVVSL